MPHSCNALLQILKLKIRPVYSDSIAGIVVQSGFDDLVSTRVKCKKKNFAKLLKTFKENSNTNSTSFNHFTTEMPNYNKETTPDTTEIYSFFGQPGFNLFNASKPREKSKPTVSYSTVIVHGPNPKPSK